MKFIRLLVLAIAALAIVLVAFRGADSGRSLSKINGVSFVAPVRPVGEEAITPIKKVNANWIAITPYAFAEAGAPGVRFNHTRQWWGERQEGIVETVKHAKKAGLKVMIKPHVWVRGQGWAGDFELETEQEWKVWEKNYGNYILSYARIADSLSVEMLCIGTEYRKAANKRPEFWRGLIGEIRAFYDGKLTYAANWDNYENIRFWSDLDYIGIDSYFPLSEQKDPSVAHLKEQWVPLKKTLQGYATRQGKPIIFTEFGYESVDYTADGHWKYERDERALNLQAQAAAYRALFESLWDEPWFAGGFLWKWYDRHEERGGPDHKNFTPQNKPAEQVIREWYGRK